MTVLYKMILLMLAIIENYMKEIENSIGNFLVERVKKGIDNAPIFYNDLCTKFTLPSVDGIWYQHPLCEIFEALDQEDASLNRPFRTALVIGKESNMPGKGFYEARSRMLNKSIPQSEKQKFDIFIKEINQLHDHYKQ